MAPRLPKKQKSNTNLPIPISRRFNFAIAQEKRCCATHIGAIGPYTGCTEAIEHLVTRMTKKVVPPYRDNSKPRVNCLQQFRQRRSRAAMMRDFEQLRLWIFGHDA